MIDSSTLPKWRGVNTIYKPLDSVHLGGVWQNCELLMVIHHRSCMCTPVHTSTGALSVHISAYAEAVLQLRSDVP